LIGQVRVFDEGRGDPQVEEAVEEHLEHHRAQTPEIRLEAVEVSLVDEVLWRHILGSATSTLAHTSAAAAAAATAPARSWQRRKIRNPEINEFGHTMAVEHDVLWLDVTMDHAMKMKVVEG
jgi:hypothetical protein